MIANRTSDAEDRANPVKLRPMISGSFGGSETVSETESLWDAAQPTSGDESLLISDYANPQILAEVDALFEEDKILDAARLLRQSTTEHLPEKYKRILDLAAEFENAISDLTGPPDKSSGWIKQGERHGKWPTLIYTKFDEGSRLSCRIETPIEASLLIPLLSVLNETDIYDTWIPSFRVPKFGVEASNKLDQAGRADQTIQLVFDLPWPISNCEVIVHARGVDEIDTQQYIVIRLNTLKDGPMVPPRVKGVERLEFDGAFLFRACPPDHELVKDIKTDESLVLVCLKVELHTGLPQGIINFFTRTVVSRIWAKFMCVANDVRHGKRPKHDAAIKQKPEMYKWIEERTSVMLDSL